MLFQFLKVDINMLHTKEIMKCKGFEELTEYDLGNIKSEYGSAVAKQYRDIKDIMIIKLRNKKINNILKGF